jgi:hypothetical protein
MKHSIRFAIPVLAVAILALFALSFADDKGGAYEALPIITVPPPNLAGGFDISWVDSAAGRYYLSDRTKTPGKGRIDVVDTKTDQFLFFIGGFAGNTGNRFTSGPAGVLAIHDEQELWAGDGDSTAKVVDLRDAPNAAPFPIPTGGKFRADELAYDPADHIIVIANDADTPPFVTFISQERRVVVGHISFPGAVFPDVPGGPAVNHGLEQPVWDQPRRRFYISVPATATNVNGEVDEIDPRTMTITRVFPINTPCGPAGLALLPGQRLITSCGVVLDAKTGNTLATLQGVSGDEIWFNDGDDRVYFGSSPVGIVDANTLEVLPTTLANENTHSVAADSKNNHIFVPDRGAANQGIGIRVFAD